MIKNRMIYAVLVIGLALNSINVSATGLGIAKKGTETFKLNKNVGPPVLKFISTAPLEDIEGNVKSDAVVNSSVSLDPSEIEKTSGMISFRVVDIESGITSRDEHMQSPDWLDAAKYPNIEFTLGSLKNVNNIKKNGDRISFSADAIGTFSMHGKSRNIAVPVNFIYVKESSATKKRAPGDFLLIDGGFTVMLRDFNVAGRKGIVGSRVGETINIQFKLYYSGD